MNRKWNFYSGVLLLMLSGGLSAGDTDTYINSLNRAYAGKILSSQVIKKYEQDGDVFWNKVSKKFERVGGGASTSGPSTTGRSTTGGPSTGGNKKVGGGAPNLPKRKHVTSSTFNNVDDVIAYLESKIAADPSMQADWKKLQDDKQMKESYDLTIHDATAEGTWGRWIADWVGAYKSDIDQHVKAYFGFVKGYADKVINVSDITKKIPKKMTQLNFPQTLRLKNQKGLDDEYPFSPDLDSNTGLPKGLSKNAVPGKMWYINGQESLKKFPYTRPTWKSLEGTLKQQNGDWTVGTSSKNRIKTLAKTPPIFSINGIGIARPYLFFSVMGVMEKSFVEQTKSGTDFSRFPILQAIKDNYNPKTGRSLGGRSSIFSQETSVMQNELAYFPLRQALLDSDFYLVGSDTKIIHPSSGGSIDYDTYNARKRFEDYLKKGKNQEEARRLAFRDADIRYLQETHPGAAFMLASNIDSLEGGMEHENLEQMQYGAVQGENAVLATMGAAIVRKYCIDKKDRMLLRFDTGEYEKNNKMVERDWWELKGSSIVPMGKAFSQNQQDRAKMLELVRVGVHKNVAVTSGYYDPVASALSKKVQKAAGLQYGDWFKDNAVINSNRWSGPGQYNFSVYNSVICLPYPRVHQIFAAAYDVKRVKNILPQNKEIFAKKLLYAMYRGTIVAAANLKVEELFLTCLGCGAFGNDPQWVHDILHSKEIQDLIQQSGMKVYMVGYAEPHTLK